MSTTLLAGGSIVTSAGVYPADVVIDGSVIATIGAPGTLAADTCVDCSGRLIMPGLIDTHSHAEGVIFDPAVQDALLAQGVTTVIGGQDGVSFAPGDGRFATEYFAAINGSHPTFTSGSVADLLATYDATTALNVAYAVPAGTVRHIVCGRSTLAATPEQQAEMASLVAQGMADGAVGVSTGLDYVPGMFQSTAEIAALVAPVAAANGVYISHMRGGYEANSAAGIHEIRDIALATGVAVHVSHFHADPPLVTGLMDELSNAGVRASFDLYPYARGCTLLGMPLLPPELSNQPVDAVIAVLADPEGRERLRTEWFPEVDKKASLGPNWPDMITLAHLESPDYVWAQGLTIAEAAARTGQDAIAFTLDVLLATRLRANAVMAVQSPRPDHALAAIFADPRHQGGSDGIFIGAHPHPRARGSFARYLGTFVREQRTWTWEEVAERLSAAPAATFGLGQRGRVAEGWIADLIVVDPRTVAAGATYENPNELAVGIDDVFVAGVAVRRGGAATGQTPGAGLRRTSSFSPTIPRHIVREDTLRKDSMPKQAIKTENAPQPVGPYSQAVEANGFVYTAGFGPQDPATGAVADNVGEQTRQVLRNIQAVLAERGLTLDDAVKSTVHLATLADFAEFNAAYKEFFTEPYPARTTVGSELANILVEIDLVVAVPQA